MKTKEKILIEVLNDIRPLNAKAIKDAKERQAKLAKPPGSLGELEHLSIQLAGITGNLHNQLKNRRILVFAADNGICEEGVSSAPQSVTWTQCINMTRGLTGVGVLSKFGNADLVVCDVGVNYDFKDVPVLNRKIAYGTKNLRKGSAMTREEALEALLTGVELAKKAKEEGYNVIGIGEMGIGNTTTSSAVLSVLLDLDVADVTGKGGGITEAAFKNKIQVIRDGIALNQPDKNDPIDVISKVGGFDLCAMSGAFLGAAAYKLPVVIDGFISVVAALCAMKIKKESREYFIPSHESFELGYRIAIKELGLHPLFNLEMRLGEGSGCPLAFTVLDAACAVMNDMATFEEANINDDYLDEIRKGDSFSVSK